MHKPHRENESSERGRVQRYEPRQMFDRAQMILTQIRIVASNDHQVFAKWCGTHTHSFTTLSTLRILHAYVKDLEHHTRLEVPHHRNDQITNTETVTHMSTHIATTAVAPQKTSTVCYSSPALICKIANHWVGRNMHSTYERR